MRILIAEDDFVGRTVLSGYLAPYGAADIATNGREAVEAAKVALEQNEPYDLICLDIMMPDMDGQQALDEIRKIEELHRVASRASKVIMTTALDRPAHKMQAFRNQCDGYVVKPFKKEDLERLLGKLDIHKST